VTPGTEAAVLIVLFAFGAAVGSFANVCIYRLPRGESIISPRSRCPACGHQISAVDNIPILSYLLLNGRCRHCAAEISVRYPAVEILTALLFSVVGLILIRRGEPTYVVAIYLGLIATFVVVSFIDWDTHEIPDRITISGMALGPVLAALFPKLHFFPDAGRAGFYFVGDIRIDSVIDSVLGLVVGAGLTYIARVLGGIAFRKEAMGLGDVKYMGMIGSILGVKFVVLTFFIAPLFGLLVGLVLMVEKREHRIPYGPFLSMGALTAMIFGPAIINWFFFSRFAG